MWDDSDAHADLDSLVERCDDARHALDMREADLIANSSWVKGLRPARKSLVDEILKMTLASAYSTPRTNTVNVTTSAEATMALRNAREPLRLVVENRLRDGDLILAAVDLCREEPLYTLMIAAPPSPPAVEIVNAGGTGELGPQAERLAQEAEGRGALARLIVVRDSDQRSAVPHNDSDEDKRKSLIADLRSKIEARGQHARLKVWTKRASENYLPDAYWEDLRTMDSQNPIFTADIDELLGLSALDRDFVDMGQSGKGRKKVSGRVDASKPYHLTRFRERVKAVGETTRTKWADSLRQRDGADDLRNLLEWMEELR